MYKLTGNGVLRLADGVFIPEAEDNRDWAEFQAWVQAGGSATLADAPNPVQESILGLERQQRVKMTERADREFRVGVMEAIAALQAQATGVPLPTLLAQMVAKNKGYREMKDLDDQIAALRSQL